MSDDGHSACLHARRREGSQLLLHTVGDTWEHGGTAGKDDVAVEIATDIEIALVDGVVTAQQGQRRITSAGGQCAHVVS